MIYSIPIVSDQEQMQERIKEFYAKLPRSEKVVSMQAHDQYLFIGTEISSQMNLLQEEILTRAKAQQELKK